jgi:hypothetical protein
VGAKKRLVQAICDGNYEMLAMQPCHTVPPRIPLQNIENKEEEKILPRKILHTKELDTKIFHPKDLRSQICPDRRKALPAVATPAEMQLTRWLTISPSSNPRTQAANPLRPNRREPHLAGPLRRKILVLMRT